MNYFNDIEYQRQVIARIQRRIEQERRTELAKMQFSKCLECMKEQFCQCKDNPCNYRNQTSHTFCLNTLTQDTCTTSNTTNINRLINLDQPTLNKLLTDNCNSTLSLLISNKININKFAANDVPLLIWACKGGYHNLIELLLINGADMKLRDENHKTVIENAINGGCKHVIDVLIKYGFKFDELDEEVKKNYLDIAISRNNPKMIKYLLHWGFDPNSSFLQKMNAQCLELLLSHGINMEKATVGTTTIANYIISTLKNEMYRSRLMRLRVLFKYVDVLQCENHEYSITGRSLLHQAASQTDPACLEYLLKLGLNPNSRELDTNKTPLHIAAESKNVRTKTLLIYRSNVGATDCCCNTPLHEAVKGQKYEDVRDLLLFGAQPHIRNFEGLRPVDLALDNDDKKSIEWMLLFGADFKKIKRLADIAGNCTRIREFLTRYEIMKKIVKITQDLNDVVLDNDVLSKFEDECKKEVIELKSLKISDSDINWIDLLLAGRHKLAKISYKCSGSEMMNFLENRAYVDFPIYANWIWKNVNISFLYGPLYDKAVESLNIMVDSKLPLLVNDKIMAYLNLADMKNIIEISQ